MSLILINQWEYRRDEVLRLFAKNCCIGVNEALEDNFIAQPDQPIAFHPCKPVSQVYKY